VVITLQRILSNHAGSARRREALAATLVGLISLGLYLRTMYPDVTGGDSGELIASALEKGVAHPPGYPLYALLARCFSHVPHGTLAWRCNLLSAFCAAGAASLLCLAVSRARGSVWSGTISASLFAFAPGVWQYAICAEVFALNNLICAALFFCAVAFSERGDPRWLALGSLAFGLGLSNHHTVLFAGIPVLAWGLLAARKQPGFPRIVMLCAVPLALGLVPYLYLWFAARTPAEVSWGNTGTWSGFLTHVLRSEYGTFQLAAPIVVTYPTPLSVARAFVEDIATQLPWWALVLVVLGIVAAVRQRRNGGGLSLILLVLAALPTIAMVALARFPVTPALYRAILARFWQQPELYLCAVAGYGWTLVSEGRPALVLRALGVVLCALPPVLRFAQMDHHDDRTVRSYGAEILRAARPGALLLTRGDLITNTTRYLQFAERLRPDVRIVDQELLGFDWHCERLRTLHPELSIPTGRYLPGAPDSFSIASLIDDNFDRSPIWVCGGHRPGDQTWETRYVERPMSLCAALCRANDSAEADRWVPESEVALPRIERPDRRRQPGSWEAVAVHDHWAARTARANALMEFAGRDSARRWLLSLASRTLEEIAAHDPDPEPESYKLRAQALGRLGLDTPEQEAEAREAWRAYLRVAPSSDPLLPAIREEILRLERR
jgi:hypothetical protein